MSPQSFSFSAGATASANGLRTEMIQFTVRNADLIRYVHKDCGKFSSTGVMIDGDLQIREFIYDKATMAATDNLNVTDWPPTAPPTTRGRRRSRSSRPTAAA